MKSSMNLLIFNLAVDSKHVTLSFGLNWIRELALRFDHIDVITMTAGDYNLPENVTVWSVGKEMGFPEWLRAIRFYYLVAHVFQKRHVDIVFTHMIPIFALLFLPIARLTGLKNVLWYAHGSTPYTLKIAHRIVDWVVSSTPMGFRLSSNKVSYVGQGIDFSKFKNVENHLGKVFEIITVSRLAPSKNLDLLIEALSVWRTSSNWHLTIIGDGTSDAEQRYAEKLRRQAKDILGSKRVAFTGRLDTESIVSHINMANVFVNMSSTGSLDKAIVEAMACGCPVVSSNDAFREIAQNEGFGECAIEYSREALCQELDRHTLMDATTRNTLSSLQQKIAQRDHALNSLISRLCTILSSHSRARK